MALRKLLVAHILGSPLGGAVAARRLRGPPASASTQPIRGGRWHLALSVLANASPPPPRGEARLGSPFGRAVAARRLRGQLASASTQPMRRGRWQLALSVLANASPPPPKGEARLGSPFGGRYVPVGRCPAAGLRCRVGRCWTSATGRQHPRRQPRRWHGASRD